ncbi:hypothetical protein AG4045_000337 [Apium graveolens]|uniref:Uncharacterized protein n=1 Tax=Apium graveolens TaxID=4045 RepID=A0A6L5B9C8_APIGR|nr:hypothetical protein AG4045_000336 [Apium graveolens]KAF1001438.1 hypothetical protein AG4045_000337 [Apium graveolens]
MVDKDTELLSKVITNHLFLGQFEPFRATLLTLRSRNENLARSILQTIVSKGGVWSFGVDSLRLRAEFALCVQVICSRVGDWGKESVGLGENVEIEGVLAGNTVLERVLEVGLSRLRPTSVDEGDEDDDGRVVEFEEEEFGCLKKVVLGNAEMFEALCENVEKQDDSKGVQEAHLDAMSEFLKNGDEDGVIGHVRFLHLDYGVEESRYRMVLQDLVKRVMLKKDEYGDTWLAIRRKLLSIYAEALSSTCIRLVQMIQGILVPFSSSLSSYADGFKSLSGELPGII